MTNRIKSFTGKLHCQFVAVWLSLFIMVFFVSCSKDESLHRASLILKTGQAYTTDLASIPIGGKIRIGVLASGAGVPLTYIRIDRISGQDTVTQVDRGIFAQSEGFDADFTFAKDTAVVEIWRVMVMNADRDTAVRILLFFRGEGFDWGPVSYYPSILLSFQNNHDYGHFLDARNGLVYDEVSVAGNENRIDLLAYYYITSGLSSPTLTCPGYVSAVGYYPGLAGWSDKNNTLYDYISADNNLVNPLDFDAAVNDSLLVTSFLPDKVSGNCKYCYTGKVIPFKTNDGKYGLIKVIRAAESDTGTFEIAIKIQQ